MRTLSDTAAVAVLGICGVKHTQTKPFGSAQHHTTADNPLQCW